jgi:hypothetical protein
MTGEYDATHPFAEWASTPAYERSRLSRKALFLHRTTNDLLAAYFAHGLAKDGDDMKSPEEICRELNGVVLPRQVLREARAFDPEMAKRMAGADNR